MPDDRGALEDEVRRLAQGLKALEARVARVEGGAQGGPAEPPSPAAEPAAVEDHFPAPKAVLAGFSRSIQYIGRLFLVMGGAYLLRSLTEGGGVPAGVGVALGLVYGLAWIGFAARAARHLNTYAASWHGIAAAMITLPLIWETSARYGIVPPPVSALLLAVSALAALAVAWRYRLAGMAWLFVVGGGVCALVLLVGHDGPGAPYAAALTILGGAALWAGRSRRWPGLIVVSALFADLAVLLFVARTLAGDGPAPLQTLIIPLLLFGVYVGSIATYVLRGWWRLDVFDVVQTAVVLALGFGEALHIARETASAAAPVGIATLGLAVGIYLLAFAVLDRDRRRCFYYLTSIALVLVLVGSASLLTEPALPWSLLAIATAWVGRRFGRVSLTLHATLYITAAGLASGLFERAAQGWFDSPGAAEAQSGPVQWLVLTGLVICAALTARGAVTVGGGIRRVPNFLTLAALTWTVGGLLLHAASVPSMNDAWRATARTGVIALLALGVGALSQRPRFRAARFLVHPLLAAGALKLLLEDLPRGVPASLAVSFLSYGAALILAHRLARSAARGQVKPPPPDPTPPAEPSTPREP